MLKFEVIITAEFSYAPSIWMFYSRRLNNRINHIHERALRLMFKNYTSSLVELLPEGRSFRIHQRGLQKLAIKIFKAELGSAPGNMGNIFKITENLYDSKNETKLENKLKNVCNVRYGYETGPFVAQRIRSNIPKEY